jgi:GDP-4-dehydro-6-deoxy-D-mannose reductase
MPDTILVTGAAGFAGSHLTELLTRDGTPIIAWHRPDGKPPRYVSHATWHAVDMLDFDAVSRAVNAARPDLVYHLAGAAHVGESFTQSEPTLAINVRGTHYLLEALRRAQLDTRVVIASSAMVYRPVNEPLTEDHPLVPASPYGLSKLAQEMLGRPASVDPVRVTIGRAFNHAGARQNPSFATSSFAKQIAEIEAGMRDPEVRVGNLDARRDTLDVRDTVRAYVAIVNRGAPGRSYNICSGRAVTVGEMLDVLCSKARVPIRVRVDPDRFRPVEVPLVVGDPTRLRTELGWSPAIPLEQTLEDVMIYWRSTVRASDPRKRAERKS